MSEKVNVLGMKIDKFTIEEVSCKIMEFISANTKGHYIFTPNSEMIMAGYRDEELKEILNSADILTADGIGVVYASKILKNPIKERCAGYDIACNLLSKLNSEKKSLYLFGSSEDVVVGAKENIEKMHPNINIVGYANGYFDELREKEIICDINEKMPDVVFVCLGVPKQEKWIFNNAKNLNAKVLMGLGGSLDVFAGKVKRAPVFFQKLGIEWLYRLIKQPKRFIRMLDLPRFAFTVLIHGKKFKQEGN
ncbi:MAG: WecB/TagA/CpsF family glycosyltransferase [Ruminococcaceae bacterium]|nr:WecB/TagA/CpsF family glycosyltransferase [Oscillospiraceae bacterium]